MDWPRLKKMCAVNQRRRHALAFHKEFTTFAEFIATKHATCRHCVLSVFGYRYPHNIGCLRLHSRAGVKRH